MTKNNIKKEINFDGLRLPNDKKKLIRPKQTLHSLDLHSAPKPFGLIFNF